MTSSGSPDQITRSASLPTSSEPIRSAQPMILAGWIVTARSAVTGSRPSLTASVAWWMRKWIGTTGWSVVIAIVTPAAASRPGLAREFGYDLVIDHGTEAYLLADQIAAASIPVIIGPLFTSRSKVELRNRSLANPGRLAAAGVTIA